MSSYLRVLLQAGGVPWEEEIRAKLNGAGYWVDRDGADETWLLRVLTLEAMESTSVSQEAVASRVLAVVPSELEAASALGAGAAEYVTPLTPAPLVWKRLTYLLDALEETRLSPIGWHPMAENMIFRAALEATSGGVAVILDGGGIAACTRSFLDFFGAENEPPPASLEQLLALISRHLANPDDLAQRPWELENGEPRPQSLRLLDGRILEFLPKPLIRGGERSGWVWTLREITEWVRFQEATRLLDKAAVLGGEDFFWFLAEHLAELLGAPYVVIGELLEPERDQVQTLAVWARGELLENFRYPLSGSPCAQVIRSSCGLCIQNLPMEDPGSGFLGEVEARTYLGIPVQDGAGQVLGVVYALFQVPLEDPESALRILELFQTRSSAELLHVGAQRALAASQALLQVALDQSPVSVVVADVSDGGIILANEAARSLRGSVVAEESNAEAFLLCLPDGRSCPWEQHPRVRAALKGEFVVNETYLLKRGLEERWVLVNACPVIDARGRRLAAIVVTLDTTEIRKAEEILRIREAEFRSLFEINPEAMVIHQDGRVLDVNSAFQVMLGYSMEEFRSRSVLDFLPPSVRENTPAFLDLAGEEWCEVLGVRKDGTVFPMTVRSRPLPYRAPGARLAVVRDLSEQKRQEEAMLHTQKLESLGVLAGGIAHDFNNLLAAILTNADLALVGVGEGDPVKRPLERIALTARRAGELCHQLLAYAGRGRFRIESLELNALLQETTALLEVSIPKTTELVFQLEEGMHRLQGDASQIRQAVMNLVINASDAIGDAGGSIVLRSGWCALEPGAPLLAPLPEGNYAFVEVQDSGSGMSEETLRRIFDPFFTTKTKGRGLGLAAVLGIMRGHRGGVSVTSHPGKGTSFRLYFPLVPVLESRMDGERRPEAGWKCFRGSGTVLMVEGEEASRLVLQEALEKAGFGVLLASDGQGALEQVWNHRNEISLVLMDPSLPGPRPGLDLISEIRRDLDGVPIIVMGELSNAIGESDSILVLEKPFALQDLWTALESCMGSELEGS